MAQLPSGGSAWCAPGRKSGANPLGKGRLMQAASTLTRNSEADPVQGAQDAGGLGPSGVTFLQLPVPPSANELWKNIPRRPGRRAPPRVATKTYQDWKGHAATCLKLQAPRPVRGTVLIVFNIERTSDLADVDNRIKPTLDLLVAERVIDDDRHVSGLAVAWAPPRDALMHLALIPVAPLSLDFQLAPDGRHGGWFLPASPTPEDYDHG